MDAFEQRIFKIIQTHGPLLPEEILRLYLQSLTLAEREEMEVPISVDDVRRVLANAVAFNMVVVDTSGYKLPEIL